MIETERLLLRRWRADDEDPFTALNTDPEVMEYFPGPIEREATRAMIGRIEEHFDREGFGLFAIEVKKEERFVGFVGLTTVGFETPFTPAVEIGWRLAKHAWGHGYASEAARRSLDFGFEELGLDEIVSFTVPANRRSQAVMQRIGMTHDPADDFEHPRLAVGHELRPHVLYRIDRARWRATRTKHVGSRSTSE